ncbi:hypothetical protein AC579_436 [Pseudocercospora musae]|uniref:Zn(2)-C6 fungal-type domain-containing protein n=1 Tax=Pseudocercospora musae TaxID=113226 RepID=A0A139I614_9PEZI|nr:hypothetical protein AC579_436 [Pseudocercospora musae]
MPIEGDFRRKLGTACASCKRRKIRCDMSGSGPCSPCQRTGKTCEPHPYHAPSPLTKTHPRPTYHRLAPADAEPGIAVRNPEEPANDTTRDENLTAFYERGIGSSDWRVYHGEHVRVLYVGNATSNLHQLVETSGTGNRLHYSYPPIKPALPWRPAVEVCPNTYLNQANAQDLSSLPAQDVRDALIDTYFGDIHPGFPIIDQEHFRKQYADAQNPPPLLLLHSMLLAAARISDHPKVVRSREAVTATLFRRAKTLFNMRYENDRVHLVQSALLLAWYDESSDTVGGGCYHWVGQATRIAFGLGMHRDLGTSSRSMMPDFDKREYRKCWWAVLQAEAFISLEFGRPGMIRYEDYDQPPLATTDFNNYSGSADSSIQQEFCAIMSHLSEIALRIAALHSPRNMHEHLPNVAGDLADIEWRLPVGHDIWSCQIRMYYSFLKLTTYRARSSPEASIICAESASTILTTLETMAARDQIRKCQLYFSTALYAAAIQFAQEVRSALLAGSKIRAVSAHAQLERTLHPAQLLAKYWPNAKALHKLCISLSTKCLSMIHEAAAPDSDISTNAINDLNWQEIMGGTDWPDFDVNFDAGDWMNIS